MLIISHRGNLEGSNKSIENLPEQVDKVISLGFDVEVDLRVNQGLFWLGHDEPQYQINGNWLKERASNLWIHCKNSFWK